MYVIALQVGLFTQLRLTRRLQTIRKNLTSERASNSDTK